MEPEKIRLALLGGLRFGKPLVIDMEDCDLFSAVKTFVNGVRPTLFDEILSNEISKGKYQSKWRWFYCTFYRLVFQDADQGHGRRFVSVYRIEFDQLWSLYSQLSIHYCPTRKRGTGRVRWQVSSCERPEMKKLWLDSNQDKLCMNWCICSE